MHSFINPSIQTSMPSFIHLFHQLHIHPFMCLFISIHGHVIFPLQMSPPQGAFPDPLSERTYPTPSLSYLPLLFLCSPCSDLSLCSVIMCSLVWCLCPPPRKYLLRIYRVPGSVVGTGNTAGDKTDKNPHPHRADILVGGFRQ